MINADRSIQSMFEDVTTHGQTKISSYRFLNLASAMLQAWIKYKEDGRWGRKDPDEYLMYQVVLKLIGKNQDYSNRPLLRFGMVGFIVRLGTKASRLLNLLEREDAPNFESIEDTFLDSIGYCILAVMYCRGLITEDWK